MFSPRSYAEKRNFHRMVLNCPISYSDTSGLRTRQGTAKDLSAKGIAFFAADDFPVGATLTVNLEPGVTVTPAFSVMVKILRVERNEKDRNYLLACTIEEIQ